ncbi:MAG: hypothetical protein HQK88_16035 [Nitrospirae bacterium]|nr:hypothetical protein [Nitrospirota bacterium]MBF0618311.1 hypothetical protein [Nitrospirota bacterium]
MKKPLLTSTLKEETAMCPYYESGKKRCKLSWQYPGEKIEQYVYIGRHTCTSHIYEACSVYVRSLFLMVNLQSGQFNNTQWR